MNKSKKIVGLLAITVLILGVFAFKAANQNNESDYILIDVYEVPTYEQKGIHIHFGPNNTKVIPFKNFKTEFHDDNGELLVSTLNELKQKGYQVIQMSSGKAQSGMITKILLEKK